MSDITHVVYNARGNPAILVVVNSEPENAWLQEHGHTAGKPGLVDFTIHEVDGWSFAGGFGEDGLCFMREGSISNADPTGDYHNAEWVARGTVKWDGCVDWKTGPEGCLAHACDAEGLAAFTQGIEWAYAESVQLMGVVDE